MLYVTTRVRGDAFTARHALTENRGPEGGFYLPMRMPEMSWTQIDALAQKSFGQNVADVMNLLFNTDLNGWAVDFAIGRHPLRLVSLSGRVTVAELWHNPDWQFQRLARNLAKAVLKTGEEQPLTDWMIIAARIAMLFGLYGELRRVGQLSPGGLLDVAVPAGDLSGAMAAWYARMWGLPIGSIVACCNENSSLWSLLRQGQLRTDAVAERTSLPKCDQAVPADLERLIHGALGLAETVRFCEVCRRSGEYVLQEHQLRKLREGIRVCVVSSQRIGTMISGIYQNNGYISDPYTALCYSGLMDYRAGTGESRPALIFSEESPAFSLETVSAALGISGEELKERIDRT